MVTTEFGVERKDSELLGIRKALEQPFLRTMTASVLVAMTVCMHAYTLICLSHAVNAFIYMQEVYMDETIDV